jgi:hypothetical protein
MITMNTVYEKSLFLALINGWRISEYSNLEIEAAFGKPDSCGCRFYFVSPEQCGYEIRGCIKHTVLIPSAEDETKIDQVVCGMNATPSVGQFKCSKCGQNIFEGARMQKLEFLLWNGKQYVLMAHEWELDEITVNRAQVIIKLKAQEKPEPDKSK